MPRRSMRAPFMKLTHHHRGLLFTGGLGCMTELSVVNAPCGSVPAINPPAEAVAGVAFPLAIGDGRDMLIVAECECSHLPALAGIDRCHWPQPCRGTRPL